MLHCPWSGTQIWRFAPDTLKCLLCLSSCLSINSKNLIIKPEVQIILFLFKDLRNKAIFVDQHKWRPKNLIQAFTLLFFPMVSAFHTWKKCVMWVKAFSGMQLLLPPLLPLSSYSSKCWFQRRNCFKSNMSSSLNFKASLCVMTIIFPTMCQH